MRKSSRIALVLGVLLAFCVGGIYLMSQAQPTTLTQEQADKIVHNMQEAVARKSVSGLMTYISPDPSTRIAGLNEDQLRVLLARAFRDSSRLSAKVDNLVFQSVGPKATVEFDLRVDNEEPGMQAQDYKGHVTLHLQRVDISHFLGLYQTKEWRIVGADSTGPDPGTFGDLP